MINLSMTSFYNQTRNGEEGKEIYNAIEGFELEFENKLWLTASKHHCSRPLKKK
jgi:hypothetical protein